jgi:hypothetical protein
MREFFRWWQQARTEHQHDPGKADTIQMPIIQEMFPKRT